jgi:hypothetical protein
VTDLFPSLDVRRNARIPDRRADCTKVKGMTLFKDSRDPVSDFYRPFRSKRLRGQVCFQKLCFPCLADAPRFLRLRGRMWASCAILPNVPEWKHRSDSSKRGCTAGTGIGARCQIWHSAHAPLTCSRPNSFVEGHFFAKLRKSHDLFFLAQRRNSTPEKLLPSDAYKPS